MDNYKNNKDVDMYIHKNNIFDEFKIPINKTNYVNKATNDQESSIEETINFDNFFQDISKNVYSNSERSNKKIEYFEPKFADNYFAKFGDINNDGKVDKNDLKKLQKEISNNNNSKYDIDGDGELSIIDVTILQKYLSGNKLSENDLDIKNNKNIIRLIKNSAKNLSNTDIDEIMKNKTLVNAFLDIGKVIDDFPSENNFHDGNWCADFVSQKLIESGIDIKKSSVAGDGPGEILDVLKDAGAKIHFDSASLHHNHCNITEYSKNYSPKPGDIVVFDRNGDGINDHTGFVVKDNEDGTITTIEGNTSGPQGSSCVAVHEQISRDQIFAYATLPKDNK